VTWLLLVLSAGFGLQQLKSVTSPNGNDPSGRWITEHQEKGLPYYPTSPVHPSDWVF